MRAAWVRTADWFFLTKNKTEIDFSVINHEMKDRVDLLTFTVTL